MNGRGRNDPKDANIGKSPGDPNILISSPLLPKISEQTDYTI